MYFRPIDLSHIKRFWAVPLLAISLLIPAVAPAAELQGGKDSLVDALEALSADSTALLKEIMERCETGETRLKGLLPKGTVIAHKTGTIGGTTNDVGVITLPHNKG